MFAGQAVDDEVERGVGDQEQLLDAGGDEDPARRVERSLVELAKVPVLAHRHLVDVQQDPGEVAEQEGGGQTEEGDVQGPLLAADGAVGDVAALVGRLLLKGVVVGTPVAIGYRVAGWLRAVRSRLVRRLARLCVDHRKAEK